VGFVLVLFAGLQEGASEGLSNTRRSLCGGAGPVELPQPSPPGHTHTGHGNLRLRVCAAGGSRGDLSERE
jgi:hypothetical protein